MPSEASRLAPPPNSRIAVVGGCGGFGRALVETCLANELEVAVLDLDESLTRHPPPERAAMTLPLDATSDASVEAAFARLAETWSALDALVFLVGFTVVPPRRLTETSPRQWDEIVDGNLRSAYLTARSALPLLERSERDPAIVTVSSGLAYAPLPGFGPYAAAKAGLVALTKALAIESAPHVRANAVAPSASLTAFMGGGTGRGGEDSQHGWFDVDTYVRGIPLARVCEPADVVGPILFLAGPASAFITGQVIHVNGGKLTP